MTRSPVARWRWSRSACPEPADRRVGAAGPRGRQPARALGAGRCVRGAPERATSASPGSRAPTARRRPRRCSGTPGGRRGSPRRRSPPSIAGRPDGVTSNPSRQTTPEAPELQAELARIRDLGCTHVALETSSHGLEMHRADDVAFRAAVFTRITTEHLELHGTRDAYLAAKARLLERVSPRPDGIAVLDAGDPFGFPRLSAIPVATRLTYTDDADDRRRPARARRRPVARPACGSPRRRRGGPRPLRCAWPGRFNVRNALAALGLRVRDRRRSRERGARARGGRAGRPGGWSASTSGSRSRWSSTTRTPPTRSRRCCTSCAGRRRGASGRSSVRPVSATSRSAPAMGAVAARLADISVITDEDPRDEDRLTDPRADRRRARSRPAGGAARTCW